ncbi:MAG: aspartyl-phosphate phosphatase Spo0E family protein [Clostridiaceae bacterium]|nr:aspartyl-phosphate phosphatase Spo0E family protein [Clostridiaceae bacterium]
MDQITVLSTVEIEELRKKLNEELARKEFIDEEILHISQELDILIAQYVKEKVLLT